MSLPLFVFMGPKAWPSFEQFVSIPGLGQRRVRFFRIVVELYVQAQLNESATGTSTTIIGVSITATTTVSTIVAFSTQNCKSIDTSANSGTTGTGAADSPRDNAGLSAFLVNVDSFMS